MKSKKKLQELDELNLEPNSNLQDRASLNQRLTSLQAIINEINEGTHDWTSYFAENGLLNVFKTIEQEFTTTFNTIFDMISIVKSSISEGVENFDNLIAQFLQDSSLMSKTMEISCGDIDNLPMTDSLEQIGNLFDFTFFNNAVDEIGSQFNTLKDSADLIKEISKIDLADDLPRLSNIADLSLWEVLSVYSEIESKFLVQLSLENVDQLIIDSISKFQTKTQEIIALLSIADKLENCIDTYSDSFSSILYSQIITRTLISYLGEIKISSAELAKKNYSTQINLGSIPTPIGSITISFKISAAVYLGITNLLSVEKMSNEIKSGGGIAVEASGGWSFVVGEVVGAADLKVTANASVVNGFKMQEIEFFVQASLAFTLSGKAGLYYRLIEIRWNQSCIRVGWFRFCWWWPSFSWGSPNWFLSVGYASSSSVALIPYTVIKP